MARPAVSILAFRDINSYARRALLESHTLTAHTARHCLTTNHSTFLGYEAAYNELCNNYQGWMLSAACGAATVFYDSILHFLATCSCVQGRKRFQNTCCGSRVKKVVEFFGSITLTIFACKFGFSVSYHSVLVLNLVFAPFFTFFLHSDELHTDAVHADVLLHPPLRRGAAGGAHIVRTVVVHAVVHLGAAVVPVPVPSRPEVLF